MGITPNLGNLSLPPGFQALSIPGQISSPVADMAEYQNAASAGGVAHDRALSMIGTKYGNMENFASAYGQATGQDPRAVLAGIGGHPTGPIQRHIDIPDVPPPDPSQGQSQQMLPQYAPPTGGQQPQGGGLSQLGPYLAVKQLGKRGAAGAYKAAQAAVDPTGTGFGNAATNPEIAHLGEAAAPTMETAGGPLGVAGADAVSGAAEAGTPLADALGATQTGGIADILAGGAIDPALYGGMDALTGAGLAGLGGDAAGFFGADALGAAGAGAAGAGLGEAAMAAADTAPEWLPALAMLAKKGGYIKKYDDGGEVQSEPLPPDQTANLVAPPDTGGLSGLVASPDETPPIPQPKPYPGTSGSDGLDDNTQSKFSWTDPRVMGLMMGLGILGEPRKWGDGMFGPIARGAEQGLGMALKGQQVQGTQDLRKAQMQAQQQYHQDMIEQRREWAQARDDNQKAAIALRQQANAESDANRKAMLEQRSQEAAERAREFSLRLSAQNQQHEERMAEIGENRKSREQIADDNRKSREQIAAEAHDARAQTGPSAYETYYRRANPGASDQEVAKAVLDSMKNVGAQAQQTDREKAMALASNDTRWLDPKLDNAGREAIVQEYMNLGKGTPAAPAAPKPGSALVAQAPQVGEVRKGYRFKGGNPADAGSWEKVE